jgi:hypothetical protein
MQRLRQEVGPGMMRRLRVVARVAPQVPALHLQICIIVNLGACCLQRSQQCSAVAERCAAARPVRKAHSGRTRDVASRRRALPARLTWYAIFVSLPNSTELLINCDATIARQCVRTPITAVRSSVTFAQSRLPSFRSLPAAAGWSGDAQVTSVKHHPPPSPPPPTDGTRA